MLNTITFVIGIVGTKEVLHLRNGTNIALLRAMHTFEEAAGMGTNKTLLRYGPYSTVVAMLRSYGSMSFRDLAYELAISDGDVRHLIDDLEARNVVESDGARVSLARAGRASGAAVRCEGERMKTIIYTGQINEATYGENDDALYVGDNDDAPLAMRVVDDMEEHGQFLSVRYFISDEPKSEEQLTIDLLRHMSGIGDATYHDHYSEITGYLWTDEELTVGGHNLMGELSSAVGRFLWLEITYNTEEKTP